MGSGPNVLTVLPLACSPSLGKYSERSLCTHSSCSTPQVSIALVLVLSSFYASASQLTWSSLGFYHQPLLKSIQVSSRSHSFQSHPSLFWINNNQHKLAESHRASTNKITCDRRGAFRNQALVLNNLQRFPVTHLIWFFCLYKYRHVLAKRLPRIAVEVENGRVCVPVCLLQSKGFVTGYRLGLASY